MRGEAEQPRRVVFRTFRQREFAAEEIGFAHLGGFHVRSGMVGSREHRLGCRLPKEKPDHGRGPAGHIDLRNHLLKTARQITAQVCDLQPQRAIGVVRVKSAILVEIGEGFWERARVEIGEAAVEITFDIFGIEAD